MACEFVSLGVLHSCASAVGRPTGWVDEHENGVRAGRGATGARGARNLPYDMRTHQAAGVATSPAAVGPRITRGAARVAQLLFSRKF